MDTNTTLDSDSSYAATNAVATDTSTTQLPENGSDSKPQQLRHDCFVIGVVVVLIFALTYVRFYTAGFTRKRIWNLVGILLVLLLIVSGIYCEVLVTGLATINPFSKSVMFNILTLCGILFAIAGLYYTYKQVKMYEDKIDGYEKLYKELLALFDDKKKIDKFQFFGPTLIPGQITYGDADIIEEYRQKIVMLPQKDKIRKNVRFITYDDVLLKNAYDEYNGKKIHGITYNNDPKEKDGKENKGSIPGKLEEINSVKSQLDGFLTLLHDKGIKGLIDNYYFSNGHTVIFVTPLHYLDAMAEEKPSEEKLEPVLVGFKTTDRSIVKAFEKKFNRLVTHIEKRNNANLTGDSSAVTS